MTMRTPTQLAHEIADAGAMIGDERRGVVSAAESSIRNDRARYRRLLKAPHPHMLALSVSDDDPAIGRLVKRIKELL